MANWLQKLDLNRWWKVAIAVGLAVVVAAAAAKDHGVAAVGFGIIAIGFGEWTHHRMEKVITPRGTLTTSPRFNRTISLMLDGLGIILIALGLYRVLVS